ncbi:MAG: sulfotransferase [Gloeomargaritaceae cyanobacterium C42_A2020_066]|nr:sulfotransferase [Gloeomargaritaceae cyanobacterium C42_A2020_066]
MSKQKTLDLLTRLRLKLSQTKYQAFDLMLEKHWIASGDYTRFVVLTRARSGSNLLVDALHHHPDVIAYNEVLHISGGIIWGEPFPALHTTPDFLRLRTKEPAVFLEKVIFRQYPAWIKAVGFKLHQSHLRRNAGVKEWLEDCTNLKIIHLVRRNRLASLVSARIALIEKQWISKSDNNKYRKNTRITLDHEQCLQVFKAFQEDMEDYERLLASHNCLKVYYEDICDNFQEELNEVQSFLALKPRKLETTNRKIRVKPLFEIIENYEELKKGFQGTPYAEYFDDIH